MSDTSLVQTNAQTKIVTIGGGTGSFTLLNTFKDYFPDLSAIVAMADNGGSTGRLRDELGVLPPGDVRKCLVALSDSPKVRDLFDYRFTDGELSGHTFGNLFLTALEKLTGSFAEAVETAGEVLNVRGQVIPATLDNVQLKLHWAEQEIVLDGEDAIDISEFEYDPRLATLSLMPAAQVNPLAITAISEADIVVIAPGDLYTSLGQVLVADGIRAALEATKARVVYVCNLVTKQGQTEGFDVADHAREIERFIGAPVIDTVLYNAVEPSAQLLEKYAKAGEFWVAVNPDVLATQHFESIGGNFLAEAVGTVARGDILAAHRTLIRHDAAAIAEQLLKLA